MLTTFKHFHTDVYITNIFSCSKELQPMLKISVAELERKALVLLLGECITNDIISSLTWSNEFEKYVLKADVPESIKHLVNGFTYETDGYKSYSCGCGCSGGSNCKTKTFPGIIQELILNPNEKVERNYLAYYIYYHWKILNESITASTGEVLTEVQNSTIVYNKKKRYNAWNRFVDFSERVNEFVQDHKEDYPNAQLSCLHRLNIWDI